MTNRYDTNRFGGEIPVSLREINNTDYVEHILADARDKLIRDIFRNMNYSRWYAIRVTECWPEHWQQKLKMHSTLPGIRFDPDHGLIYFRLLVDIKEIQTEHVTFYEPEPIDYNAMSWSGLSLTALGEIKHRVKRLFKRRK